jgi:OmpA family/PEGA domain
MMRMSSSIRIFSFAVLALLMSALPAFAQSKAETGKLKIRVSPKQAYVFVDGKAIREGDQTIDLAAGTHEVGVDNYGYISKSQKVNIGAGETTKLNVILQSSGDMVSEPFGDIEFKGYPRAAVLLNGTTPAYFVGHVDEFDWDWIWHQRLLVQPGSYQIMVTRKGDTIWSGPVTVKAGQKVVVDLNNRTTKTVNWPAGMKLGPQPRFHAGIASATVPVAPVTAQLSAQPAEIGCGQATSLDWNTADAVDTSITGIGEVPAKGDRSVTPTKSTEYQITAKGPGGVITRTATVDVNNQPNAAISLSQSVVHYRKVGDKVVENDPATLKWAVSNADRVTIFPLGSEALSGSQTVEPKPRSTDNGSVNEVEGYTLVATNACGGKTKQTALLRVVGSIEPAPEVVLASVFYPTKYPRIKHPQVGLVSSQKEILSNAAKTFKDHEEYASQASLLVLGYADVRGGRNYNMKLSERRAELAKDFLISKGVPAEKIETRAEGKEQQLTEKMVAQLQSKDAEKPEKWMKNGTRTTWLAYNRRVDIVLEPTGQQSAKEYPNDTTDARILWQRPEPSLKTVEMASKAPATMTSLHASNAQN